MPDYQLAKIYMLTCDNPDLVYYGATTKKYLCDRLSKHNYEFKNKIGFITSKCLFEAGNVKIELVENFPCNDKNELNAREAHYIRNNQCVNKCIPGRTKKEYREENKERKKELDKNYREANKEKIRSYGAEKITCPCGSTVRRGDISSHKRTNKHKTWEESQT
jgi:hypothetical protein